MYITYKGELINTVAIKRVKVKKNYLVIQWADNGIDLKIECGSEQHALGEYNSFVEFLSKKDMIYNFPVLKMS